jgi:hypothetical protein
MFSSALSSETLSICVLPLGERPFHYPYKTTGKTIVLYILVWYLDRRQEGKRFRTEW